MKSVGELIGRIAKERKGAEYHPFNPPRKPEEYIGQLGPHGGFALTWEVQQAIATSRATGVPHGFLVRGEWVRKDDGVRYLDFAVDRAWVQQVDANYHLVDGRLRWVCPTCGQMSGTHRKGCDYR